MWKAARDLIRMRSAAITHFQGNGDLSKGNFFAGKVHDSDNFSVMMLLDLNALARTITDLSAEFPDHFLHTFAAKANPVRVCILQTSGYSCTNQTNAESFV